MLRMVCDSSIAQPSVIAFPHLLVAFLDTTRLMAAFNRSSGSIRSAVPDFYSYAYDVQPTPNHISDGGNDMFDGSNKVKQLGMTNLE